MTSTDMDDDMITDVTLDIPDLSEASMSFQIPSNGASADLLLADHTDGFDLLCHAVDNDTTFAPLAPTPSHPRGSSLLLSELTPMPEATRPRSRSTTPTRFPPLSASAKHTLALGRRSRSPEKRGRTPSRTTSVPRQMESPLVSSERFDKLRADLATFVQDDASSRVRMHVSLIPSDSPSCTDPLLEYDDDALQLVEHRLDAVPEENAEEPVDQDVAMATNVDYLDDATVIAVPRSSPESTRNPRTIAKPTVAASTTSDPSVSPATHVSPKVKSELSRVGEPHAVLPFTARQFTPPQSIAIATDSEGQLVPPACMSGDIDLKSENTQITHPGTGGMAERLVSYSQKLISSIGLYRPWPDPSTEASSDAARAADARVGAQPEPDVESQSINDIPVTHETFRLSEISPHKPPPIPAAGTGITQDGKQHAVPSMRTAKKRISTDADLPQEQERQYPRRKRSKPSLADADSDGGPCTRAQPRPHKSRVVEPAARDGVPYPDPLESTLPSARTKYKPKLNASSPCKGPTLDAFPCLSRSRQVREAMEKSRGKNKSTSLTAFSASARLRRDQRMRRGSSAKASHTRQPRGATTSADLSLEEKKQNATLCVAPPTKPVGFTFRVDARLEARKAEVRLAASEPGRSHPLHPVPELKPLRTSQDPSGIVPNVPVVPFFFCTEQRAKEREKYDATIRRKEEEMQRVREEQRRREAEEEEEAIKALRRKAIPKANEIPNWYADMPKRKGMV